MVKIGALIGLIWTLCGAVYHLPPGRAEDCNGAQKNKYIIHNCCNGPVFNLDQYKEICADYMPQGIPKVSTCLHECVYNASEILIDDQVNLDNVRVMFDKLLSTESVFYDVCVDAFSECSKSIDEMKKLIKRRPRPTSGIEQCSALPLMISICTQRYVTSHCPEPKRITTETCDKARQCETLG